MTRIKGSKDKKKRNYGGGRPRLGKELMKRESFMIGKEMLEFLINMGNGNQSKGLRIIVDRLRDETEVS